MEMFMRRTTLAVVVGCTLAACATDSGRREALFNRASFDLGCDKSKLDAVELNSTSWPPISIEFGVTGCEKKAAYIVSGDGVAGYTVRQNGEPSKK
jgi:hypothetical protein